MIVGGVLRYPENRHLFLRYLPLHHLRASSQHRQFLPSVSNVPHWTFFASYFVIQYGMGGAQLPAFSATRFHQAQVPQHFSASLRLTGFKTPPDRAVVCTAYRSDRSSTA